MLLLGGCGAGDFLLLATKPIQRVDVGVCGRLAQRIAALGCRGQAEVLQVGSEPLSSSAFKIGSRLRASSGAEMTLSTSPW